MALKSNENERFPKCLFHECSAGFSQFFLTALTYSPFVSRQNDKEDDFRIPII